MKKVDLEKALATELKEETPNVWDRISANIGIEPKVTELAPVMAVAGGGKTGGVKKKVIGFGSLIAFVLCAIVALAFILYPLAGGGGGGGKLPSIVYGNVGYVVMDINPSVQLKLDNKGLVTSVLPLNEDARVMLAGKDELIGLSSEAAIEKVFGYAYDLGYISPSKKTNAVLISAQLDDADSKTLLESKMKKELDDVVRQKGLYCVVLTDAKGKSVEADAKKFGITEQKMRLINNAIKAGAVITDAEKPTISVAEIYERMSDAAEKLEDSLPDELEKELEKLEEDAENLRDGLGERVEQIVDELKEQLESEENFTEQIEFAIEKMESVLEELKDSTDVAVTLKKLYEILDEIKLDESLEIKVKINLVKIEINNEKIKFDIINKKIEHERKKIIEERDKLLNEHKTENENHKKDSNYDTEFEKWLKQAEKDYSEDWESMKSQWQLPD